MEKEQVKKTNVQENNTCPDCDGSGWITSRVHLGAAVDYDYPERCRYCNLNGEKSESMKLFD